MIHNKRAGTGRIDRRGGGMTGSTVRAASVRAERQPGMVRMIATGFLIAGLAIWATATRAQDTIVAHGISTFGDLKYPADFAHLDYVNPDAPKGGEISQSAFGGFDSMNPYSEKGRAAALSSIALESILGGTNDEISASYCLLCTTLEYPEDRSWVIFNLRDDVTFSDGTPMTAEDVVFSFEILRTKGLTDFRTVFNQEVEGAEILGPLQVKFTFKPDVPWRDLPQSVGGLPVFSKAAYEAANYDLSEDTLVPLVGTGAYVYDRMNIGSSVTYRRREDYWGSDHPLNVGRQNFDNIRIEYYGDDNAAFEGFKAGNYTFRNETSSIKWATGYDFPAVLDGTIIKADQRPTGRPLSSTCVARSFRTSACAKRSG
jgi:microcin C transport system substrate-binding protein